MPKFAPFEHSEDAVRQAGEVISGDLTWNAETADRIRTSFTIANQWRDSHAYPMRSIRGSLRSHIWRQKLNGFTAARLKRMNAIRSKLRRMMSSRRRPLGLNEFQDLGGCRAIMHTMAEAETLIRAIKERSRHTLWAEDDYIHNTNTSGGSC